MTRAATQLPKSAQRALADLAGQKLRGRQSGHTPLPRRRDEDVAALLAADLAARHPDGSIAITPAGLAHLARAAMARANAPIDPFRAQHLDLALRTIDLENGIATVDDAESPLAWLARRKGRDGRMHIAPVQLQAGERLRAEFTRAQLMPRTTSNWSAAVSDGNRGAGMQMNLTETVISARQRVCQALDAVGPEFAGLLLDVCCFLKGLADVEGERGWPPRSAKVVLQLGLDRLARHYGFAAEARGRARAPIRTWLAPEAAFTVGE